VRGKPALPAPPLLATDDPQPVNAVRMPGRLRGRVLLVDDDPMVRFTTADMLSYLGYAVTEVADATQALVLLGKHTFDVIVTDIALPDLSGDELAMRAVALQPGLRVIFASGYDELPDGRKPEALAGATMLRKPYDRQQMEALLDAAMMVRVSTGSATAPVTGYRG
jgi:CheY-like chemotaxis protein